jgi:RNA polymerase sigma-70 factor (ECF subfamily)
MSQPPFSATPEDREALAEQIQALRVPLLAYIQRRLGTALRRKVEADDVFQEACAEALRTWPVDLAGRSLFSWLCQLAEQRLVDLARRFAAAKRDVAREAPLVASDASRAEGLIARLAGSFTTPSQALSRQDRYARLNAALAQLPDAQRQALVLRYLENWPSQQIAAYLGKTDGAVRVLLTRGLKRLQALLEASCAAPHPPPPVPRPGAGGPAS